MVNTLEWEDYLDYLREFFDDSEITRGLFMGELSNHAADSAVGDALYQYLSFVREDSLKARNTFIAAGHTELEASLMASILVNLDLVAYGVSQRYVWLTDRGSALLQVLERLPRQ